MRQEEATNNVVALTAATGGPLLPFPGDHPDRTMSRKSKPD